MDATGILNRDLEKKLDESRGLLEGVTTELCEAEELVIFLEDQKESILDDVEKMKGRLVLRKVLKGYTMFPRFVTYSNLYKSFFSEAIFAQDQFIDLLEADIVIYEEHVGLLRDSLGASKVNLHFSNQIISNLYKINICFPGGSPGIITVEGVRNKTEGTRTGERTDQYQIKG